MESEKEYYAFISYKREDKKEAKRLQHALEYYRLPNNLRQENPDLPEYVRPVFRDMTDLEVGELSAQIHSGLEQSHFLIVICSPRAAKSKWVNDEVSYFISLGKQDKIIPYITKGIPHASNPEEECYPPALLNLSKENELLGANINEVGKDSATIRVVSRMFNIRFDTLYQRYQREQKKHRVQLAAILVLAFLFLAGVAGWIWHQNVLLKEQRWKMQENQSRAVAKEAIALCDKGDYYTARKLAIEVLPKNLQHPDRPYVPEAEVALRKAWKHECTTLSGHSCSIEAIAISPDGQIIASGSEDGDIILWNATTKTRIRHLKGHTRTVTSLVFNQVGEIIISGSSDGTIRLWDVSSGEMTSLLKSQENSINSIAISPSGKLLAAGGASGTIHLYNIANATELWASKGHISVQSLSFNENGTSLVSGGWGDKTICFWDISSGLILGEINSQISSYVNSVAFSPDGMYIATGGWDQNVHIWDAVNTNEVGAFHCHTKLIRTVSFDNSGEKIISGGYDGNIFVQDIKTRFTIAELHQNGSVNCVAISKTGDMIISGGSDSMIYLWDVFEGTKNCVFDKNANTHVRSANYNTDGNMLLVGDDNGIVHKWDMESNYAVGNFVSDSAKSIVCVAFDKKENRFLCATHKEIYLIDNHSGELVDTLHMPEDYPYIQSVSFGHNGEIIAVGLDDGTIRIWSVEQKYELSILNGHEQRVSSISFSQDGKLIASGASDGSVCIWDTDSKSILHAFLGHTGIVETIVFGPDNETIAIGFSDGSIVIYNMDTENHISTFKTQYAIYSIAFSIDGHMIAAGGWDYKVYIFDVSSKQILCDFQYDSHVCAISFNMDVVKVCYRNGQVINWKFLPLQKLIDKTERSVGSLTPEQRHQYFLE